MAKYLFWTSVVSVASCVGVMIWLSVGSVSTEDFGVLPRILIVFLLLVFSAASMVLAEVPWRSRNWTDWRRPKVLAAFAMSLLAPLSFVAGLGGPFDRQDAIAAAVGVGQPSLISQRISGVWGEPGCEITYRFELEGGALRVRSLRSSPAMASYEPEYTILSDHDDISPEGERSSTLEANEAKGFWPGYGVQFRYVTNGSTEKLIWDHRKLSVMPLKLDRCPNDG